MINDIIDVVCLLGVCIDIKALLEDEILFGNFSTLDGLSLSLPLCPPLFLSSGVELFPHRLLVFGSSQLYKLGVFFLKMGRKLTAKLYKDSDQQIAARRVCQAMKK